MDQQDKSISGISLPQPQDGGGTSLPAENMQPLPPQEPVVEPRHSVTDLDLPAAVPAAAPPVASWLPPTVPLQPSNASGALTADDQTAQSGQPQTARDADLIEKEWVVRAKAIAEQARLDPFTQAQELHKLRAEYMKSRYDKTLEVQGS